MKKKTLLSLIMIFTLSIVGCSTKENQSVSSHAENGTEQTEKDGISEMFTDRDYEVGYDESKSTLIKLNGDSAACSSDAVRISGNVITITDEGTYILTGTLDDGMIIVDAEKTDKPQLVLDGVSINSETSSPIYIREADKVFVTLAPDTANTLSNGGTFSTIDENNIDAVIFSKQDLTLNGSGSLAVSSPAGHGIVSKDDLVITSGTYTVDSASHGLDANDSIRLVNAKISIDSGKDGMHAENSDDESLGFVYIASGTFDISAEGDGISAEGNLTINQGTFTIDSADDAVHSNSSVTVNGGKFEIASGDDGFHADETLTITSGVIHVTESYEGLEGLHVEISGGEITVVASDDGINAAGGTDSSGFGGSRRNDKFAGGASSGGSITISGGTLSVTASGDGLDANGTLAISGGYVSVCGPNQGDTATLDYDISGVITGGTFIGTGASGMAQTFSDSEQGVIAIHAGNQSEGTEITLTDSSGKTIITHTPELPFSVVIISTPDMSKGAAYTITVGSVSGEFTAS